jgi:hypothetical protein
MCVCVVVFDGMPSLLGVPRQHRVSWGLPGWVDRLAPEARKRTRRGLPVSAERRDELPPKDHFVGDEVIYSQTPMIARIPKQQSSRSQVRSAWYRARPSDWSVGERPDRRATQRRGCVTRRFGVRGSGGARERDQEQ